MCWLFIEHCGKCQTKKTADREEMTHRIALIRWGTGQLEALEATRRHSQKQLYLISCLAACSKWMDGQLGSQLPRRVRSLQFLDKILDRGMSGKIILIPELYRSEDPLVRTKR